MRIRCTNPILYRSWIALRYDFGSVQHCSASEYVRDVSIPLCPFYFIRTRHYLKGRDFVLETHLFTRRVRAYYVRSSLPRFRPIYSIPKIWEFFKCVPKWPLYYVSVPRKVQVFFFYVVHVRHSSLELSTGAPGRDELTYTTKMFLLPIILDECPHSSVQ